MIARMQSVGLGLGLGLGNLYLDSTCGARGRISMPPEYR